MCDTQYIIIGSNMNDMNYYKVMKEIMYNSCKRERTVSPKRL